MGVNQVYFGTGLAQLARIFLRHSYKDYAPTERVTNKADTLCALLFNSKVWPCSGLFYCTGCPLKIAKTKET
jgi:hypothetical protein